MSTYTDIFERCCAIEEAAVSGLDGVPYFLYTQEHFPYITHRADNASYQGDSEDIDTQQRTVILRVVIGHVTEGYVGQPEAMLYDIIDTLEEAFATADARRLVSEAFPVEPAYLYATDCYLTGLRGLRVFENSGVGARQVGTELTLNIPTFIAVETD
jgi:hypothetical protein